MQTGSNRNKSKWIIFVFLIFFAVSLFLTINSELNNTSKRTLEEIQSLVANRHDSLLFLSFWAGMSLNEKWEIIEYEENKGNLENGVFNINFIHKENSYSNDTIKKVPFNILSKENSVVLSYSDKYESFLYRAEDIFGEKLEYINNGLKYESLIYYLIKTFDDKYERLNHIKHPFYDDLIWVDVKSTPNKVIRLESYLKHVYYEKNYFSKQKHLIGYEIKNGIKANYNDFEMRIYEEKKRFELLSCKIKIHYQTTSTFKSDLDDYFKQQENNIKEQKYYQELDNKKRQEREKQLQENNSKL